MGHWRYYAGAEAAGLPLLYIGEDFAVTDVASALPGPQVTGTHKWRPKPHAGGFEEQITSTRGRVKRVRPATAHGKQP